MGMKPVAKGKVVVRVLVILLMTMLLFTSTATPVYAKDGPSPFSQAITLRISALKLIGIRIENNFLLQAGVEPTPWRLFQLHAEVMQLKSVYDQISDVLSTSPSDTMVLNALADVQNRAQGIVDDISMTMPPDNQRMRELLEQFSSAAQAIIDMANSLIIRAPM
jgi:hypothetical protein